MTFVKVLMDRRATVKNDRWPGAQCNDNRPITVSH
jgi:hypothetical protein